MKKKEEKAAKYARMSAIKDLLYEKSESGEMVKIRVSDDAKPYLKDYIDKNVEDAAEMLSNRLPTYSSGESAGKLKRVTIMSDDLEDYNAAEGAKYARISTIKKDALKKGNEKIRVSAEAKGKTVEYFDKNISRAIKRVIDKLPRKTKGNEKGELKRTTLYPEDFI